MSEPTMPGDSRKKRRALKHVVILALVIIILAVAGQIGLRMPAAAWAGPLIVVLLFIYGAWILLWFGPMRNL